MRVYATASSSGTQVLPHPPHSPHPCFFPPTPSTGAASVTPPPRSLLCSAQVPLDVCAHACQLLGASLFVASRQASPETWVSLVNVIPEGGVDGLLECLRVGPARAKAARALFYAAKAPLAGGTGGELIESRGGVSVRLTRVFLSVSLVSVGLSLLGVCLSDCLSVSLSLSESLSSLSLCFPSLPAAVAHVCKHRNTETPCTYEIRRSCCYRSPCSSACNSPRA